MKKQKRKGAGREASPPDNLTSIKKLRGKKGASVWNGLEQCCE